MKIRWSSLTIPFGSVAGGSSDEVAGGEVAGAVLGDPVDVGSVEAVAPTQAASDRGGEDGGRGSPERARPRHGARP